MVGDLSSLACYTFTLTIEVTDGCNVAQDVLDVQLTNCTLETTSSSDEIVEESSDLVDTLTGKLLLSATGLLLVAVVCSSVGIVIWRQHRHTQIKYAYHTSNYKSIYLC